VSRYFVLAYKRSEGRLIEPVFETGVLAEAGAKRFGWEQQFRAAGSDVEVAVLTAPSLADLQKTHARYFKSAAELTG
jgi:hypothetical protein